MTKLRQVLLAAAAFAITAHAAAVLLLLREAVTLSRAATIASIPALVFALIGLGARYPCNAMPLRNASLVRIVPAHAAAAAAASALWLVIWNAWTTFIGAPRVNQTLMFSLGAALYGLSVTVHYLAMEIDASRRAEETALRYQLLAREAELKAFKAQIDPHFLFNSLNAVAALCTTRPADARQMTQRIADFFRQTVRLGALERITLGEEIDLLTRYLEIEKVRFGDRMNVTIDVGEAARSWLVPPLLLQPLVENSVRHGIASMVEGGTVSIAAQADDDLLRIRIENPTDPDRPQVAGERVGVENARGRLAAISGGRAALRAGENAGMYRVEIELPR